MRSDGPAIDVGEVVTRLRAINHSSAWERTMAIGSVVFHGVFAGDLQEWRAKRGNKATSLRKVVAHPACPFRKSALSSAVNVFLFVEEHPLAKTIENITPTHIGCVCSLPGELALELLECAGSGNWPIRLLAERVVQQRRSWGEKRGRPKSTTEHQVEALGKRVLVLLTRMEGLLSGGEEFDDSTRQQLLRMAEFAEDLSSRFARTRPLVSARRAEAQRLAGEAVAQQATG